MTWKSPFTKHGQRDLCRAWILIAACFTCTSYSRPVAHHQQQHVFAEPDITTPSVYPTAPLEINSSAMSSMGLVPRWGQASVLLPDSQSIVFMGGRMANGSLTSDTVLLDLSALQSSHSAKDAVWRTLSSEGVSPHAFAAASVMGEGLDASVWLIGGITRDCEREDTTLVHIWTQRGVNPSWNTVSVDKAVPRHRGARAVRVLNGKKPSLLILGGEAVHSNCSSPTTNNAYSGPYFGLERWTSQSKSNSSSNHIQADVESVHLPERISDVSLIDYSTVQLPRDHHAAANSSASNDRVLLLGGRTADGSLASFAHFRALCLQSGRWESWSATGAIPAGRVGHSTIRMPNGKILLYGGAVQADAKVNEKGSFAPVDETYILDPSITPAVWSRVQFEGMTPSPARAYHASHLVGDVMVVAFGKGASEGEGIVHFLDLASHKAPRWFDGVPALLAGRRKVEALQQKQVTASQDTPALVPSVTAAKEGPASQNVPTFHPSSKATTNETAKAASPTSSGGRSAPNFPTLSTANTLLSSTSNTPNPVMPAVDVHISPLNKRNHAGAAIGSAIGASAAALALLGTFYAHKRRSREDQNVSCEDENAPPPPVSSLRLSRSRSMSFEKEEIDYGVLPAFRYADTPYAAAAPAIPVPLPAALSRRRSSESIGTERSFASESDLCISHLSYPFLSAMHRTPAPRAVKMMPSASSLRVANGA